MSFLWCPTLTGEQPTRAQKAAIRIGDYDTEILMFRAALFFSASTNDTAIPPF
jgi:hypothetical protein